MMQRRDVIKLLASSAVMAAMPAEVLQSLQQARAETGGAGALRTLNAHQNATVITMSEIIIPETETPGAKGTKVNEFLDLLLTEWFDKPDADKFLDGLAKVDATSKARFGKVFIDLTPAQQTQLMKQWDAEAIARAHPKLDDKAKSARNAQNATGTLYTPAAPPVQNFFFTFKKLTLVGYYTSEVGFSKELGKHIIPPKHAGCAPLSEARA